MYVVWDHFSEYVDIMIDTILLAAKYITKGSNSLASFLLRRKEEEL